MFGLGVQEITILVLLAFFATPSLIAALVHNRSFQQSNPNLLSYRWGYFQAWSSVLGGIFLVAIGFLSILTNSTNDGPLWIFLAILLTSTGLGVMWRTKWGWILLCFLSITTAVACVINILYAKNRWIEFSRFANNQGDTANEDFMFHDNNMNWEIKLLIAFSVVIVIGTFLKAKTSTNVIPFFFMQSIFFSFVYFLIIIFSKFFKTADSKKVTPSYQEMKNEVAMREISKAINSQQHPFTIQKQDFKSTLSDNSMNFYLSECKNKVDEITITTFPSGLSVYIDEKKVYGTTPIKIKISKGQHLIQLYCDENSVHSSKFILENQEELVFNVVKECSSFSVKLKKYLCLKCMQEFESKSKFCVKCGSLEFVVNK